MMTTRKQIRAKIRRWYVPDAVYFITPVTLDRRPVFLADPTIELLRATMRSAKKHHPFTMHAYVFLPDHFHLLIFVPETTNISKLMQSIQRNFTLNYKGMYNINRPTHIWQRSGITSFGMRTTSSITLITSTTTRSNTGTWTNRRHINTPASTNT